MKHRDGLGRVLGKGLEFFNFDDEFYRDEKVENVRFPKHNQKQPSKVKVYHISELTK